MGNRKCTCLYLDKGMVETAKQLGLNTSKVSENALIEAIRHLKGGNRNQPKYPTAR